MFSKSVPDATPFYKDAPDYIERDPVTELKFVRDRLDPRRSTIYVNKLMQADGLHFIIDRKRNSLNPIRKRKSKQEHIGKMHARNVQYARGTLREHKLIPPGKDLFSPIMIPILFIYAQATSEQQRLIRDAGGVVDVYEHGPGVCEKSGRLEKNIPSLILANGDNVEVPGAWPILFDLKPRFNEPSGVKRKARRSKKKPDAAQQAEIMSLHPAFEVVPVAAYEQDITPTLKPRRRPRPPH